MMAAALNTPEDVREGDCSYGAIVFQFTVKWLTHDSLTVTAGLTVHGLTS
jgi:hypothetical protein